MKMNKYVTFSCWDIGMIIWWPLCRGSLHSRLSWTSFWQLKQATSGTQSSCSILARPCTRAMLIIPISRPGTSLTFTE